MKQNRLIAALGAVLLLLPTLAGCAQNPGQTSSSSPSASPYETSEVSIQWDEATATKITLSGGTAQFGSSAVSVDGGVITIQTAGDYLISGELTDGQIVVDAGKEDTVRLILSNASISCSDSAAIYARQAGRRWSCWQAEPKTPFPTGQTTPMPMERMNRTPPFLPKMT